ncbi:MAG: ANTAR domain-containing protein [Actinomycetota bacterium]|nr:ANTAR domain-containing protein [Actinomycetota bacterium]
MRAELGAAIASAPSGLATADQLCNACVDLLGVDGAAISVVFDGASQGTYGSSSEASRRLDEYQFTFGEGPCLDATAADAVVYAPDLDTAAEHRWPAYTEAVLGDGIGAVFALPVRLTSACIGVLDLFRLRPGPLQGDELAGGMLAAELAVLPLLALMNQVNDEQDAHDTNSDDIDRDDIDSDDLDDIDGGRPRGDSTDQGGSEPPMEMDRVEVYKATGILIAQLDVDAPEALARLRAHAVATGATASEVAREILDQGLELERDDQHGPEGTRR